MIRRAVVTWIAMIPVAIANGVFRETVIAPATGDQAAHQISVVSGSAALFGVAWALFRHQAVEEDDRTLLKVGLAWLAGTVAFEFGFGHFLDGKSWSALLHDYNVLQGRLWPVVLLVISLAPLGVKHLSVWLEARFPGANARHA